MNTGTVLSFATRRDVTGAMLRYDHLYRVAEKTIDFSNNVKIAGIVLGGTMIIGGIIAFQVDRTEQPILSWLSLALGMCAIAVVLVARVLDKHFRAQGHLLEVSVDIAVNSSPFLTDAQRGELMGLGQQLASGVVPRDPVART